MDLFKEAASDMYHYTNNPDGAFPLNIAENKIMSPVIREKFHQILSKGNLPEWIMGYTNALGQTEVRETIADFMQTYFGSIAIQPYTLCFSAGASASLEVISFILGDPGDVVVIPAPAYPMYTNDLGIKNKIERFDLQTHFEINDKESLALVTVAHLEKTLQELKAEGKTFKMLLLTSPDNPSGSVYDKDQLLSIAQWCIQNKIHLIVNEIYALSPINDDNHQKNTTPFYSFAVTMQTLKSDCLHLIYGLSKDFGISGMRFGIIHSLNENLLKAASSVNIPHMVSNITQWLVGEMFKDKDFISDYLVKNEHKLTESYITVISTLERLGIPYVPAKGSLFVWADFSKYLTEDTEEAEMELWKAIFKNTKVLFTPGVGFQHQKKGLFRIVHSAVPTADLKVAMERIEKYLERWDYPE